MFFDEDFPPDLYPIRLQGPWRLICGGREQTLRLPLRARLELQLETPVRLVRNFQAPTNLDREERVLLILPPGATPATVQVGETELQPPRRLGDRRVWDLAGRLKASNRLEIVFTEDAWQAAFQEPVLLGVMPDADGSWWSGLPLA